MNGLRVSKQAQYVKWIPELYPPQGEWTEEDYLSLPETMRFVELVNGVISLNPSHTPRHQIVLGNLVFGLYNFLEAHPVGEYIHGPYATRLRKNYIRMADIIFAFSEHMKRFTNRWFRGAPDWIIEVIMDETRHTDEVIKLAEYERANVPEYWIVDPDNKSIRAHLKISVICSMRLTAWEILPSR